MNIKDIAKLAGVSVATVSRVINGNTSVKKEAKETILKIINETNYIPTTVGVSMRRKKSNIIGIILPIIHSYYTERFNSIAAVCSDNGYENMILTTSYSEEKELKALSVLMAKQVDGIIFMTTKLTERHVEIMNKCKGKMPMVVMDSDASSYGFSSVVHDDYSGAEEAMKYLIANGHRKIAFISGGETNLFSTSQRYKAYEAYMLGSGAAKEELIIISGNYSMKSGYDAVDKLVAAGNMPTALFCANDNMAMGAGRRLYELGYKIPDDISIIGTDDIEPIKYMVPASLTTIRQELSQSGLIAIEMIMEYINTGANKLNRVVMKQKLVERESVKRM